MTACNLRIGTGFDVHRLVPGRPLLLGGLHIPFELGLEGHSDGDALIHAIIDALLGAASLGDIGIFFPPTDDRIKNIHSADMMRQVIKVLKDKGWSVINIDAVVICEKPKLSGLYRQIAESLAKLIDIEIDRVSVKAKTAEKLGEIGTGNALAVQAVALIEKSS